jgi:hypothetical protein
LIKYDKTKNTGWTENDDALKQQENLIRDIESINKLIIDNNIKRDLPTVLIAKPCYISKTIKDRKTRKKKTIRKFTSKGLTDGVHADDKLRDAWFERIVQTLHKLILSQLKLDGYNSNEPTDSSESEEDRSPNPKQRKVTVKRNSSLL